jgi:putative nucleotidyltransferase with HDIG domain
MNKKIDQIKQLYLNQGMSKYGENVTQSEHAVQCWYCAKNEKASLNLRVAAFLHDIGHLLYAELEMNSHTDFKHEELGAQFLHNLDFNNEIVELILSHVWAKRYLITQNPDYIKCLSQASIDSFHAQGGLLTKEEMHYYKQHVNLENCLLLRKWDDMGKNEHASNQIPEEIWKDILECLE